MKKLIKRNLILPGIILLFILIAGIAFLTDSNASTSNVVRFVQITDVHLNPYRNYAESRMIKNSQELLEDAIDQVNHMKSIDFVVFTGDNIDNSNEKLLIKFAKIANKLNVPWYWTTGNHDLAPDGLSRAKFLEIMNTYNKSVKEPETYYSFKKGNILFIALDGAIDTSITAHGFFF